MTTQKSITENLNAIHVEISAWSGGSSLKREEVGVDLPEKAFTMGRKYLIDPSQLKIFPTIRRRVRERCLRDGIQWLGGFALPADEAIMTALITDLQDMQAEYEQAVARLLGDLDANLDAWVSEPDVAPYESLIRAAMPSRQNIERRFGFRFAVYQVGAPANASGEFLSQQAEEIPGQLFSEVSEAAESLKESFLLRNARNQVSEKEDWNFSGKTLGAIEGIARKLKGLQFLSDEIPPVVGEVELILASMPRGTKLEGEHMKRLYGLLVILSSPERIMELGKGLLATTDVVAEEFPMPVPAPVEVEVEEAEAEALEAPLAEVEVEAAEDFDLFDEGLDGFIEDPEEEIIPLAPDLFGQKGGFNISF